ncbi:MAG: hypothetical protein WC707_06990 [Candidatus Babeliaceae bacterium]|jgi:hypothetical protein
MNAKRVKYEDISIIIPSESAAVSFEKAVDINYKYITGIALVLPYDGSLFGTSISLNIAGEDVFLEGHPARLHSTKELHDVSPNETYYSGTKHNPLKEEAKNNLVKGKLTDGGNATGVTFPYTAILSVRLENIEEPKEEKTE